MISSEPLAFADDLFCCGRPRLSSCSERLRWRQTAREGMELTEDEVSKECAHGVITQFGVLRTLRQHLHLCTATGLCVQLGRVPAGLLQAAIRRRVLCVKKMITRTEGQDCGERCARQTAARGRHLGPARSGDR